MKKISTEIKKTSFCIIIIFIIVIFFSLFQTYQYFYTLNMQRLENSFNFLKMEISEIEDEEEFMEIFYGDLIEKDFKQENNFLKQLEIYIEQENNFYPELKKIPKQDEIGEKYFLDLNRKELIYSDKFLYKNNFMKITLIKNIEKDFILLKRIINIFVLSVLLATILSIFISRYIVNLISKSLNKIKTLNENISLSNLKLIKPKNDFIEFENIYNSYEKMLKKLDVQNQQQIDFIHSASHELKTPLFVLSGNLEILEKYGLQDKKLSNETIISMKEELKSMDTLIEKLLFIASYDSLTLNKKSLELSNLILETIDTLKKIYGESKINFDLKFIELCSDSQLIKILFRNIIENAIKYGNNKKIDIFLKENKETIEIIIRDNGIGMNEKELKNIYTKFYRGEELKNKKQGYGLGMYIVKKIVHLINGEISIKSEINRGTEVLVKIKK